MKKCLFSLTCGFRKKSFIINDFLQNPHFRKTRLLNINYQQSHIFKNKIPGTKSAGSAHSRSKSMANMAHHRVQQSQQQTNTFSVGLSAEVNHDGEPLEAAAAAFSPHGHLHGLHSLYSSGFLRKP